MQTNRLSDGEHKLRIHDERSLLDSVGQNPYAWRLNILEVKYY